MYYRPVPDFHSVCGLAEFVELMGKMFPPLSEEEVLDLTFTEKALHELYEEYKDSKDKTDLISFERVTRPTFERRDFWKHIIEPLCAPADETGSYCYFVYDAAPIQLLNFRRFWIERDEHGDCFVGERIVGQRIVRCGQTTRGGRSWIFIGTPDKIPESNRFNSWDDVTSEETGMAEYVLHIGEKSGASVCSVPEMVTHVMQQLANRSLLNDGWIIHTAQLRNYLLLGI